MKSLKHQILMDQHVCPWWLAYTFDNPLRRYLHDPQEILTPYLREGMTAIDIGCGMGFFSRGMAHIVGDAGKIFAVDLQQEMLDITRTRSEKDGTTNRIRFQRAVQDDLGVTVQVDFALAFWMVHEVPDIRKFFQQVSSILKQTGTLLIAEPKLHVTRARFEEILSCALETGFRISGTPRIRFSRAVALNKQ